MKTDFKQCINNDIPATKPQVLHNDRQARALLRRLTNSWQYRAQVKKDELDEHMLLDDSRDDFLTDLLPFKNHPHFIEASDDMKKQILTCGWLAYNEKTVDIEAKIITPACMRIIHREVPGLQDFMSTHIASQTLVDEAYHILLVSKASQVTREMRGLSITLPESNLIIKMRESQQQCSENWQRIIIQMVTAIVSEIFISDYLKLLSNEKSIQPFNRLVVHMHRRDEMAHSSIFRNMAKCLYNSLSIKKREFFMKMLPKPVHWFASLELDVWDAMLQQIEFPNTRTLINDCKSINEENLMNLDYTGLISLAEELEIANTQIGMDSFYSEGLIE